jgi:hypothetical protein
MLEPQVNKVLLDLMALLEIRDRPDRQALKEDQDKLAPVVYLVTLVPLGLLAVLGRPDRRDLKETQDLLDRPDQLVLQVL